MTRYFNRPEHLRRPPKVRAAYSDRTAWILAEMSRLVYERLPVEEEAGTFVEALMAAARSPDAEAAIRGLVMEILAGRQRGDNAVTEVLARVDFRFIDGFAIDGTEGFLAEIDAASHGRGFRVLVFRGTEKDTYADIRTDLQANLTAAPGGGRVHAGFLGAWQRVEKRVSGLLDGNPDLPLYITGHCLGGALAMVATRYLDSDNLGATYTFGCPRVGDDAFFARLKTPVYRVVNAGDGVPRIPFGYSMTFLLTGLRLIPVNGTRAVSEWLRRHLLGYTHWGSLVFLSPRKGRPDVLSGLDFKVRGSPDIFWRSSVVVRRWIGSFGKSLIQDHDMLDYCEKLGDYAVWRNPVEAKPGTDS